MTPQLSTNYEAYNELLYEAYKLTLSHLSAHVRLPRRIFSAPIF